MLSSRVILSLMTRMMKQMKALETRQQECQAYLRDAQEPPPLLHPNMAHHYHDQVEQLYVALQEQSDAKSMAAADVLRSLIKEIVLTPDDGQLQIDVRGDLAGILAISLENKKPAGAAGKSQVEMVAGTECARNLRASRARIGDMIKQIIRTIGGHLDLFRAMA